MRRTLAWTWLAIAACSATAPASRPAVQPSPTPAAVTEVEPPPAPTPAAPVATVVVPSTPPQATTEPFDTRVDVAPGKSCTLSWTAGTAKEVDGGWALLDVKRIATKDAGACKAGVLWDVETGAGTRCVEPIDPSVCKNPDFERSALQGGTLSKPDTPRPEDFDGIDHVDMNFDGYRDLCVQRMMGAYNYSQVCWLFDPATSSYRRYDKLDPVIWATYDATSQRIRHEVRLGGPNYMSQELAWEKGELVVVKRTESFLGEKPSGAPLPAGFSSWEVVYRRKGNDLVKLREGPAR